MTHSIKFPEDLFNLPNTRLRALRLNRNLPLLVVLMSLLTVFNVEADSQHNMVKLNSKGCEVMIYATQSAALENGEIQEVCSIDGSSSGISNPTTDKAIMNSAPAACSCGTDKVYVQSRSVPDRTSAHVVLVAFQYVGEEDANGPDIDLNDAIKLNRTGARIKSANTKRATAGKVFLDDYERLPSGIAQPRPTTMIWLSEEANKG
jgi:hypothetical protein